MSTRPARGERNKNWTNIEFQPANKWVGQIGIEPPPADGTSPRFSVFGAPADSIRAAALLLQKYQDAYDLRTVHQMIGRWAPERNNRGLRENHTAVYVRLVAEAVGVSPNDAVDVTRYAVARPMIEAMVRMELGYLPANGAAVIDEGLRRAGVVKPIRTIAEAAATPTGGATISLTAIGAAGAALAPVLQALGGLPQWTGVAVVAAVLIGGAVYLLHRRRSNETLQP